MIKYTITVMLLILVFSTTYAQSELPADGLKHHFTFDDSNNLSKAAIGNDLVPDALNGITPFHQPISGYKAGDGAVEVGLGSYYRLDLDFEPNGPDTASRVNQFAIVIDFQVPTTEVWHAFHSTDNEGDPIANDADSFVKPGGVLGVGSTGYSFYKVQPLEWYRLVITVDMGNYYKYYLDGQLLQDGGQRIPDDRLSLPSVDGINQILLFSDNDGEDGNIYISELGIYNRPLTEEEIANMGGWNHFIPSQSAVGAWFFDNTDSLGLAYSGKDLEFEGSVNIASGPEDEENNYAVSIPSGSYIVATHDILANGGGERVNQYTIEADLKIPELGKTYSIFQTDVTNSNDAELFINSEGKIGNNDIGYTDSALTVDEWYKIVISVDMENNFKIYVDGDSLFDAGEQTLDGKFSLEPQALSNKVLFFADNNGEDAQLNVAYLALFNRPLSSEEVLGLGGYEHGAVNTEVTGAVRAIYFNGNEYTNKYARIDKVNDDLNFGDGDFTVELWTKPDIVYKSDPALISDKDWGSGGNAGWVISIRGDDWKFNMADGDRDRYDVSAPNISDGNWHHLAVIVKRDSGAIIVTDDSVSAFNTGDSSFFKVNNINSSYPVCIGQDGTKQYSDGPPAPAQVDEIRIWKGIAMDPEVIQEWRCKPVTPEHPYYNYLVGYWNCEEIDGATLKDVSGRGNNAEMVGSPKKVISYAPMNGNLTEGYDSDVDAAWGSAIKGESGGMVIKGEFPVVSYYGDSFSILSLNKVFGTDEVASDKEDNPYVVTGHNGKSNVTQSGVSGSVVARLNRVWSVDFTEEAISNVEVSFILSELGGSGSAGTVSNYVLLRGDGAMFSSILTASTVKADTIVFSLPEGTDGLFTLGTTNLNESPLGNMAVGVEKLEGLPSNYELSANYPNPFNPTTNIQFALPVNAKVNISVFNILGEQVSQILNQDLLAGFHKVDWNAAGSGARLASGIYIYRINAFGIDGSKFVQSRKMMLLK